MHGRLGLEEQGVMDTDLVGPHVGEDILGVGAQVGVVDPDA
eukprot:COSAG01_NODE_2870_length_6943_cov_18.189801_6_plen_41_part_00